MAILIKSLDTGAMVSYDNASHILPVREKGRLIGQADGHDVHLLGNPPNGYTASQLLDMCLPQILQLGNIYATYVTYSRLPKRKAESTQMEMFMSNDDNESADDFVDDEYNDEYDDEGGDGDG